MKFSKQQFFNCFLRPQTLLKYASELTKKTGVINLLKPKIVENKNSEIESR
jgi:hypothetical protein